MKLENCRIISLKLNGPTMWGRLVLLQKTRVPRQILVADKDNSI